jgi:hypothetical protein
MSATPFYYWRIVPRGAAQPAPTLVSITPAYSKEAGGDALLFTGTNFATGSVPIIDGLDQDDIVVVSATQITCKSLPHARGVVQAAVINADGTESNALPFTYSTDYFITQAGDNLVTQNGDKLITQR